MMDVDLLSCGSHGGLISGGFGFHSESSSCVLFWGLAIAETRFIDGIETSLLVIWGEMYVMRICFFFRQNKQHFMTLDLSSYGEVPQDGYF